MLDCKLVYAELYSIAAQVGHTGLQLLQQLGIL